MTLHPLQTGCKLKILAPDESMIERLIEHLREVTTVVWISEIRRNESESGVFTYIFIQGGVLNE